MARDSVSRAQEHYLTEPTWEDNGMATGDKLFDVTCTIGSVHANGDMTPVQAAFLLIADHGAAGVFRFPRDGKGEYVVVVDMTDGED